MKHAHGLDVGDIVHYYTHRTLQKRFPGDTQRLAEPQLVGPYPAIVVWLNDDGSVDLHAFARTHGFPARAVTTKPTTNVQHYWEPKPTKETP